MGKKSLLVSLLFIFIYQIMIVSASLGISPAKIEIDFVSSVRHEFSFDIITDDPNKEIELFFEGDFIEYGKLSTDRLVGGGTVKVFINLPEGYVKPGPHTLIVRAREALDESQFIGTRINIGAPIKIFVPYPGRYSESFLHIPDGNVDEEIPVELKVINRGVEDLTVGVYIDFLAEGKDFVHRMDFKSADIERGSERYFRKLLDTNGFKAGDYVANAVVDFGGIEVVNQSFRVGSLFVNITNFTQRLPDEGIQKYNINVESKWNRDIEEVFADVNISNGIQNLIFRTPSVYLKAWDTATLEGFLDTGGLEGKYDVNLTLNYAGVKSFAFGSLVIYKISRTLTFMIIAGIIILLAIVLAVYLVLRRRKKRRK